MKKKIFSVMLCMAMAVTMAAGCSKGASNDTKDSESTAKTEDKGEASHSGDKKFVIGVSQGTMNHPFRVAMVDENVKYAEENYPEFECITTDGQNDSATQVQDVEDLLARGIDLLLISPLTSDALTPVCEKAMEQGIPVVTLSEMGKVTLPVLYGQ